MAEYLSRDTILRIINHTDSIPLFYRNLLQVKIKLEPRADVAEVKHGYWKELVEKGHCFDHTYYICTNCGVVALDEDYEIHCHHCGAKMDGGSDT